jgi:hypothetical protein
MNTCFFVWLMACLCVSLRHESSTGISIGKEKKLGGVLQSMPNLDKAEIDVKESEI